MQSYIHNRKPNTSQKITPGIHEKIEAFVRKRNCTSIHDESKPPKFERIRTGASFDKKSNFHYTIETVHAFTTNSKPPVHKKYMLAIQDGTKANICECAFGLAIHERT